MNDYKKFLAAEILSEGKLVTYRLLSRALKVHVNKAKHMLFAFHESQNSQTPNSVHATYLVYGEKTEDEVNDDDDVEMSSSVDAEPLPEPTRTLTLTLVQEDKLKETLALYKTVLSVQIFSLGPHPTKDLQFLSDANHQLAEYSNNSGSSSQAEGHGGIYNSRMRRKERKGPSPTMTGTSAKTQPPPQKPVPTKAPFIPQAKNKAADSPSSSQGTSGISAPSKEKPVSSGVKPRSGGIMQSFAKAAASKQETRPKPTPQRAQSPKAKAPSSAMESDDDEGEEDHPAVLPPPKAPSESAAARKAREERKAELTRMMEEDESEAEAAPSSPEEVPEESPQDLGEAESKGATEKGEHGQDNSQATEVISSVGSGRRRGKRKVIKKRQIEDEDGYLVTARETVWESFSEDEAAPQPQKATTPTIPSTGSGSTKAKKPAPKGQGSIMSFFAKK